ncbi:MAG: hypothetical protein MR210_05975 [Erysipelotrichaceae bacterium]|nr:hypothetical protein [Erysipelotrichaceae bacterium]MDY5251264.1 hypothetical protein [Erysipelotrichaceae bacterium]
MKIIIIICLCILTGCQPQTEQVSNESTPTTTITPSLSPSYSSYEETEYHYVHVDKIWLDEQNITIDPNFEALHFDNPTNATIPNEIWIQKLTDPYYRIYRTYELSYGFSYEKNHEQRYAYLKIKNYRNHPDAYSNDVYECSLTVPQSDDDQEYHFYGLHSLRKIFMFNDENKAVSLTFINTLQEQIIDHLLKAQEEINKVDEANLQYSYAYLQDTYDLKYFLVRSYFPHDICSEVTSDYLYFPDCDISFFRQNSPITKNISFYDTFGYTIGHQYQRINCKHIIANIDTNDYLSLAVIDNEIIHEAGGSKRGIFKMIDTNIPKVLSYQEIIDTFDLDKTKLEDFYAKNQETIFTDGDNYVHLLPTPKNNILVYDDHIYFLVYVRAEHGGPAAIKFPITDFQ